MFGCRYGSFQNPGALIKTPHTRLFLSGHTHKKSSNLWKQPYHVPCTHSRALRNYQYHFDFYLRYLIVSNTRNVGQEHLCLFRPLQYSHSHVSNHLEMRQSGAAAFSDFAICQNRFAQPSTQGPKSPHRRKDHTFWLQGPM